MKQESLEPYLTIKQMQDVVGHWVITRFGKTNLESKHERAMRVLEEAIEFAQAEGVSQLSCAALTNSVYGKPAGVAKREAAQVMVTLLAWAHSSNEEIVALALEEIERLHTIPRDKVRGKHAIKVQANLAKPMSEG